MRKIAVVHFELFDVLFSRNLELVDHLSQNVDPEVYVMLTLLILVESLGQEKQKTPKKSSSTWHMLLPPLGRIGHLCPTCMSR